MCRFFFSFSIWFIMFWGIKLTFVVSFRSGKIISQLSVQDRTLKGNEGIIRYPVYPALNYSDNKWVLNISVFFLKVYRNSDYGWCCFVGRAFSWYITVPGGKRILLEFLKFDLENHPLCQSDHLTVFAGEDLPIGDDDLEGSMDQKLFFKGSLGG